MVNCKYNNKYLYIAHFLANRLNSSVPGTSSCPIIATVWLIVRPRQQFKRFGRGLAKMVQPF